MRPFLRQAKINIWKQPCALGTHLQSTRRYASSETSSCPVYHGQSDIQDLESASSLATTSTPEGSLSKYDPVGRAQKRNRQLPASRCVPYNYLSIFHIPILINTRPDTAFARPSTTADHSTLINLPHRQIPHPAFFNRALSLSPASNKPTKRPSPPT